MAIEFQKYTDLPEVTSVSENDKVVGINVNTNTMELIPGDQLGGGGYIDLYTWLNDESSSVYLTKDDCLNQQNITTFAEVCATKNPNLDKTFRVHVFNEGGN